MANAISSVIGVDLDNASSTQLFALGTHVMGTNNSEWVYVQVGTSTVSAYKVVAFTGTFSVAGHASTTDLLNGLQLGVAQTAMATSSFGWVAIRGIGLGVMTTNSATATAQGIFLAASSATTGVLSNFTSASGTVAGISFVSVAQTATMTVTGCTLTWPRGGAPGM